MKQSALVSLASASLVAGHGYIMGINLDGNNYPGYNPWVDRLGAKRIVWGFPGQNTGGIGPVTNVAGPDVACRAQPTRPGMVAKARAGSNVEFKWSNWLPSHKGPVITYMGRYPDSNQNAMPQEIPMFKIHENAYDPKTRTWGTDVMMKNNMTASGAVIPSDIKPGKYILRHELIALHFGNGNNPNGGGAEVYPECMDVDIISSNGNVVPEGVKFPGAYKATDPGIKYNLYFGANQYTSPGPAVYRPANPQPPKGPAPVVNAGKANPAGAMANGIQDSIISFFNTIFPGNTQAGVFKWDVGANGASSTKAPVAGKASSGAAKTPTSSSQGRNFLSQLFNKAGAGSGTLSKPAAANQPKPAAAMPAMPEGAAHEHSKRNLMIKGRLVQ